jgi:hypothetical protein
LLSNQQLVPHYVPEEFTELIKAQDAKAGLYKLHSVAPWGNRTGDLFVTASDP